MRACYSSFENSVLFVLYVRIYLSIYRSIDPSISSLSTTYRYLPSYLPTYVRLYLFIHLHPVGLHVFIVYLMSFLAGGLLATTGVPGRTATLLRVSLRPSRPFSVAGKWILCAFRTGSVDREEPKHSESCWVEPQPTRPARGQAGGHILAGCGRPS